MPRASSGFLSLLLLLGLLPAHGCGGSKHSSGAPRRDPNVVRYRLPLRENPIDRDAAFRCYGGCQPQETPGGYLECLKQCPGFDTTPGVTCASYEIPPHTACITARKISKDDEVAPGWVVVGVLAEVVLVASLASVCAANSSNCGSNNATWYSGPLPQ